MLGSAISESEVDKNPQIILEKMVNGQIDKEAGRRQLEEYWRSVHRSRESLLARVLEYVNHILKNKTTS